MGFPLRELLVFYPMLNQFVLLSKDVVLSQIHDDSMLYCEIFSLDATFLFS